MIAFHKLSFLFESFHFTPICIHLRLSGKLFSFLTPPPPPPPSSLHPYAATKNPILHLHLHHRHHQWHCQALRTTIFSRRFQFESILALISIIWTAVQIYTLDCFVIVFISRVSFFLVVCCGRNVSERVFFVCCSFYFFSFFYLILGVRYSLVKHCQSLWKNNG